MRAATTFKGIIEQSLHRNPAAKIKPTSRVEAETRLGKTPSL